MTAYMHSVGWNGHDNGMTSWIEKLMQDARSQLSWAQCHQYSWLPRYTVEDVGYGHAVLWSLASMQSPPFYQWVNSSDSGGNNRHLPRFLADESPVGTAEDAHYQAAVYVE